MAPARDAEECKDKQVGPDSRLVLVAEPLVHVLVHERGLSDTCSEASVFLGLRGSKGE